jgi:hypothetical protein
MASLPVRRSADRPCALARRVLVEAAKDLNVRTKARRSGGGRTRRCPSLTFVCASANHADPQIAGRSGSFARGLIGVQALPSSQSSFVPAVLLDRRPPGSCSCLRPSYCRGILGYHPSPHFDRNQGPIEIRRVGLRKPCRDESGSSQARPARSTGAASMWARRSASSRLRACHHRRAGPSRRRRTGLPA